MFNSENFVSLSLRKTIAVKRELSNLFGALILISVSAKLQTIDIVNWQRMKLLRFSRPSRASSNTSLWYMIMRRRKTNYLELNVRQLPKSSCQKKKMILQKFSQVSAIIIAVYMKASKKDIFLPLVLRHCCNSSTKSNAEQTNWGKCLWKLN